MQANDIRARREITVRALVLSMFLSVVLAAANAYLGLKVGMTVSASIPAAVISMGILRLFRDRGLLENNIVQTAASAGEALAAGVIFTLPALVLLGHWSDFDYFETATIAALGGLLGVLFAVPLRRVLLAHQGLTFPEGIATAEVLKAGESGGRGLYLIAGAGFAAAALKFSQTGLQVVAGSVVGAASAGRAVFAFGSEFSVALLGVGYIVGLNIALLVFAGGVIAWLVAIPIHAAWVGLPTGSDGITLTGLDAAHRIWSTKIRFMGVGAMLIGGVWALFSVLAPLRAGIRVARSMARFAEPAATPRTERDLPFRVVLPAALALAVPLFAVYRFVIDPGALQTSSMVYWSTLVTGVLFALSAGFLFSAVAGYMAGLVGSSNNPVSGVTIATVLIASLLLLAILGAGLNTPAAVDGARASAAASAAILVGAVVCCAAAISGDTMQDLKAGTLLGATPYKQQLMQVVGVLAAALVLAPVLSLLYNAYGLGGAFPRQGMDPAQALAAPQATLMQSLALGVFSRKIEWAMIGFGAVVALLVISIDRNLSRRGLQFRLPVLALAVGIYLPVQLSTAILAGGLIAHFARRSSNKSAPGQGGVLFASGLIAGEAIAGILLAFPFALAQRTDVLRLLPAGDFTALSNFLGSAAFLAFALWLYRVGRR